MKWSVLFGGIVATWLVLFGIILGSPFHVFVDPITAVLVLCLPIAFLMQAHGLAGLKTSGRALRCWMRAEPLAPEELQNACCVVETAARATINGGMVCVLIGAIQILQYTSGDNLDTLGPAMAVMFLGYFYAHCINFVLWGPLGCWLKQPVQTNPIDAQA